MSNNNFDVYLKTIDELISKGIVENTPEIKYELEQILKKNIKRFDIDKLNWDEDKKFLFTIIHETTVRYFKFKICPDVESTYIGHTNMIGGYMNNKIIHEAGITITTEIFSMIGAEYIQLLTKYFTDFNKLIGYTHYTVLDQLFELALDFNLKREIDMAKNKHPLFKNNQ